MSLFYFIHKTTQDAWSVTDPALWCLDHKTDPTLERAREGLFARRPDEEDRILRLVLRRCGLILVEINLPHVKIQHWGLLSCDLRPFFKKHKLAIAEIQVGLLNRKKEKTVEKCGQDFLYGNPLRSDFPLELFNHKWLNRSLEESDDDALNPLHQQEYETVRVGPVTWGTLKSIWQRNRPEICPNCDLSTSIVASYHMRVCGFYKFSPDIIRICAKCQRSFMDCPLNMEAWIRENVDQKYWPKRMQIAYTPKAKDT